MWLVQVPPDSLLASKDWDEELVDNVEVGSVDRTDSNCAEVDDVVSAYDVVEGGICEVDESSVVDGMDADVVSEPMVSEGELVGRCVGETTVEEASALVWEVVLPPPFGTGPPLGRQLVSDPDWTMKGNDDTEKSSPSMIVIVNWVPAGQVMVCLMLVELVVAKTVP